MCPTNASRTTHISFLHNTHFISPQHTFHFLTLLRSPTMSSSAKPQLTALGLHSSTSGEGIAHEMNRRTRHMKHGTRHTSHVTRHTSHVTRHTLHVTRHTSHVTRHTSHVTRHTSHVTRHTSHVARHTAYVARHTSHVTRQTSCSSTVEGRACRLQQGHMSIFNAIR